MAENLERDIVSSISRTARSSDRIVVPVGRDDCSVVDVDDYSLLDYCTVVKSAPEPDSDEVLPAVREAITATHDDFHPIGLLSYFGLPDVGEETKSVARELYTHIESLAEEYEMDYLGGDTNETDELILAVSCVAGLESEKVDDDLPDTDFVDMSSYKYAVHSMDVVSTDIAVSEQLPDMNRALGLYVFDANASDVISTGGTLEGIQLFSGMDAETVDEIIEPMSTRLDNHDVTNLEYSTSQRGVEYLLGATIVGGAKSEQPLTPQYDANPGDLVVVTGEIGDFAAGVYALGQDIPLDEETADTLLEYIIDTGTPIGELGEIQQTGIGGGCVDISDGLSMDITKILDQSGISGCELYADNIPVSSELREVADVSGYHPLSFTWHIGGDWESLVTVPEQEWQDFTEERDGSHRPTVIGKLRNDVQGLRLTRSDESESYIEPESIGYRQFEYTDEETRESFSWSDRISQNLDRVDPLFRSLYE